MAEAELTGTEALVATMDALRTLLASPITTKNQELQNANIEKLEAQIVRIRGEIQVEKGNKQKSEVDSIEKPSACKAKPPS